MAGKNADRGLREFFGGMDRTGAGKTAFLDTFGDALAKYSFPGVIPIPIIRVHIDVLARKLPLPTACYLPVSSTSHSPTSPLTLLFASSTSPASRSPLLQTSSAAGCSPFPGGPDMGVGTYGGDVWGEKLKEAVRVVERGSRGRNVSKGLSLLIFPCCRLFCLFFFSPPHRSYHRSSHHAAYTPTCFVHI